MLPVGSVFEEPAGEMSLSSTLLRGGLADSPTARVQRGPSDSSTSAEGVGGLFFTARIDRPPPYRGGSASKKYGLAAPSHPSEAARCTSTGDRQATPSSFAAPATFPPS
jgi:hypothetical protein